ncbi:nuclear transport factor 2 family protein [Novosphingobium sp. BL-52-GroH]|uniref:nuclear transport factor 2 family protein n=1 Tax=Novosphingobium sp. BL-52-GroH TaxID=3349877 RepID=UPI00384B9897
MHGHRSLSRRQPISAEDEREINNLLFRYATGIDNRDWPLFRSCFSVDCEADYGSFGTWRGLREIAEYMEATHRRLGPTLFRITNITVENRNDEVLARSYVDAILTDPVREGMVHRTEGYYDDTLVRTSSGWKIARRRFTLVKASLDG